MSELLPPSHIGLSEDFLLWQSTSVFFDAKKPYCDSEGTSFIDFEPTSPIFCSPRPAPHCVTTPNWFDPYRGFIFSARLQSDDPSVQDTGGDTMSYLRNDGTKERNDVCWYEGVSSLDTLLLREPLSEEMDRERGKLAVLPDMLTSECLLLYESPDCCWASSE